MGNTQRSNTTWPCKTVHPHACGEHSNILLKDHVKDGSSPRVWGTLQLVIDHVFHGRFIPTRVGNTLARITSSVIVTVHPHACGEHPKIKSTDVCHAGSSPRVWGTLPTDRRGVTPHRFIPTRVGNTWASEGWSAEKAVHPHACGEHSSLIQLL